MQFNLHRYKAEMQDELAIASNSSTTSLYTNELSLYMHEHWL